MGKGEVQNIENTNASLVTEVNDEIDVLDRKSFTDRIRQIIEYYAEKKQSVSFSIQGTWGSGKSWIINKVYNELYDIQDFDNCGSKYCIFTYNAWDYDYYDEPLISLFISLYKQLNNENAVLIKNEETRKKVNAFFSTLKNDFIEDLKVIPLVENIISFKQNYDKQLENYDDTIRKYDYHFDINQIMEATIKGLNKISKEKSLVLFVDELDRCLPEYAIKVLERIHHIKQYVKNIEIIYSIDKIQLQHTINNCFGKTNDNMVKNYLSKFIDFGLTIPPSTFNTEIQKKYTELFEQFEFIHSSKNTTIIELVKSLLPESIPIRIHQAILKKIIFINNQLNMKQEKLDYSILITELFIAISEEVNMKWENNYLQFDDKSRTAILKTRFVAPQYVHPQEIKDFFLRIACTKDYGFYPMKNGGEMINLNLKEEENNINSLALYFITRLLKINQVTSFAKFEYLNENEAFLNNFFDFYKSLEM